MTTISWIKSKNKHKPSRINFLKIRACFLPNRRKTRLSTLVPNIPTVTSGSSGSCRSHPSRKNCITFLIPPSKHKFRAQIKSKKMKKKGVFANRKLLSLIFITLQLIRCQINRFSFVVFNGVNNFISNSAQGFNFFSPSHKSINFIQRTFRYIINSKFNLRIS